MGSAPNFVAQRVRLVKSWLEGREPMMLYIQERELDVEKPAEADAIDAIESALQKTRELDGHLSLASNAPTYNLVFQNGRQTLTIGVAGRIVQLADGTMASLERSLTSYLEELLQGSQLQVVPFKKFLQEQCVLVPQSSAA